MGICISKKRKTDTLTANTNINSKCNALSSKKTKTFVNPAEKISKIASINSIEKLPSYNLGLCNGKYMFTGSKITAKQQGFESRGITVFEDLIEIEFLERVGIWVSCKKGLKSEFPNQDSFSIMLHNQSYIVGVFDGHGDHGHEVSSFISSYIPESSIINQN